jgi:hypothetical protein
MGSSCHSFGQTKKYVEEIALYHLDSLTKVDPAFKNFKYYTEGSVEKYKTHIDDTIINLKQTFKIKSPFKNLIVLADTAIKSFPVPRRLMKNRSNTDVLNILHFAKAGQEYFVQFNIEVKHGGKTALIIMDEQGNLTRRKIEYYID